jgi:hypothetical protein
MRCSRPNITWFAENELWNAVMRVTKFEEQWNIVCPICFAELAGAAGTRRAPWQLAPESRPTLSRAVGDALTQWERVPNGVMSAEGLDELNQSLAELYRVVTEEQ